MVKNSSIQQYIKKEFAAKSAVTDGELLAYYQGNLDAFTQPLQIRVSHILVQTDPKWEASRKQEARKKIDQILKNLKKGQDFGVIAREQSDGPTRTNGGDLGYIKMGQLEKQFEGKVFALNTGETSDIIETDYGFHLFKVLDKKPETLLAYDAVKEKIRQFLVEEKAKQEAEAHAKTLRQKATVKILLAEQTQHKEK
jgi:peptidyl-prolyl cis-trans isomerase C